MKPNKVVLWKRGSLSEPERSRMTLHSEPHVRDEVGASLILALLFLVVIGLIVGGLASWTANDLSNAVVFQNARSAELALNSGTQLAIQNIRYVPLITPNAMGTDGTLNASPPEYCWGAGPGSELTTQGVTVALWCTTQWNPASSITRVVTINACIMPSNPLVTIGTNNWNSLSTSSAKNPGLQTQVSFDDYESNLSTDSPCTSTCGTGMTINSSSTGATDPTVTSLSTQPPTNPPAGPVTGGTSLTITGSGFVNGSTTVFLARSRGDGGQPCQYDRAQRRDVQFHDVHFGDDARRDHLGELLRRGLDAQWEQPRRPPVRISAGCSQGQQHHADFGIGQRRNGRGHQWDRVPCQRKW